MFRTQMPRVYELKDLIGDPTSPNAYFQDFDNKVRDSPHHVMQIFLRWERELRGLDFDAWEFLKTEASPHLVHRDANGRGWQQLFDVLDQARAYNYLIAIGCSSVRFIPRADKQGLQTPDLEALLGSDKVLCEVKTINISQKEVRARSEFTVRSIGIRLEEGFFCKLRSDVMSAKSQMQAYNASSATRHYVYINLCFDDFLAQCKEDYFRQIDQYLSENPIPGAQLIFHNDHTAFYTPLRMTNATVVNDDYEANSPSPPVIRGFGE
jgi:hypothetical protein